MNLPNELECAVLRKLFAGELPILSALRQQVDVATVTSRCVTGSGFFTRFSLPSSVTRVAVEKARFGDVEGRIVGLKHGAGFLVYIDKGEIRALEGYSYGEPWPDSTPSFELLYTDEARPTLTRTFGGVGTS